jgi:hypothetical protein
VSDIGELAAALRQMCVQAKPGEKYTMIHLFGIRHAEALSRLSANDLRSIAEEAGQSPNYGTEIGKMVRLSRYVQER